MAIEIKEDFSSYFQDALPEASVEKVTIAAGGPPSVEQLKMIWSEDPHVKSERFGFIVEQMKGRRRRSHTSEVPEDKNVHVELQLTMNALIPKAKDIFASFIYNEEFFKYFRVFVISNENMDTYEKVLATSVHEPLKQIKQLRDQSVFKDLFQYGGSDANPTVTLKPIEELGTRVQTYSPSREAVDSVDHTSRGARATGLNKKTDNDGNTIISIPMDFDFKYNSDPYHLSYFTITMLDINEIQKDYPDIDSLDLEFVSRVIPTLVLAEGKVPTKRPIYKMIPIGTDFGKYPAQPRIWSGPVHQMPDGTWMTGRTHSPTRFGRVYESGAFKVRLLKGSTPLERIENDVSNIQDFRIITSNIDTLSEFLDEEIGGQYQARGLGRLKQGDIKYLTNDRADVEENVPYFSDLYSSKDYVYDSCVRLFFSMDYQSLIEDLGIFSSFLRGDIIFSSNDAEKNFYRSILNNSQLLSLKVVRKRVKLEHSGINKLGYPALEDFDEEEIPTLVASFPPNPELVPKIRRVNLANVGGATESLNDPYLKHFSVLDTEISGVSYGNYIYGVELEAVDGTVKVLSNILNSILDDYNMIKKYYELASSGNKYGPYYNNKTKKFQSSFKAVSDFTVAGIGRFSLNFYTNYLNKWALLSGQKKAGSRNKLKPEDIAETARAMLASTDPTNGSLKGIESVMNHMERTYKQLEKILDGAVSGPVKKTPVDDGSGTTAAHFKSDATRTIKVRKWFSDLDEVVDVDVPKRTGYEFLSGGGRMQFLITRNGIPGLASMTPEAYKNRILAETKKHFKDVNIETANAWMIKTDGTRALADSVSFSMGQTKWGYLTPGVAFFRNKIISLVDTDDVFIDKGMYDNDIYYEVLLNSLRYNNSLDISKEPFGLNNNDEFASSFPIGKQKIRGGLIDLLAANNCTVSSMKEFKNNKEELVNLSAARSLNISQPTSGEKVFSQLANQISPIYKNVDPFAVNDHDPSPELDTLLKHYVNTDGASTPKSHTFDLNSSKNTSLTYFKGYESQIPNQIKALILFMTNAVTYKYPGIDTTSYANDLRIDINRLMGGLRKRDNWTKQSSFPFFYYNFYNINEIQYINGYERYPLVNRATRRRYNMKAPLWKIMNGNGFRALEANLNNAGDVTLCRQVPYKNPSLGLPDFPNIDIQTYNEHFFLENTPYPNIDQKNALEAMRQDIQNSSPPTENRLVITKDISNILQEAVERALGEQLSQGAIESINQNVKALGGNVFRAFEFEAGLDLSLTQEQALQLTNADGKFNFEPFPINETIDYIIKNVDLTTSTLEFLRMKSIEAGGNPVAFHTHLYEEFERRVAATGAAPPKISSGTEFLRGDVLSWLAEAIHPIVAQQPVAKALPFSAEILARIVDKAIKDNYGYNGAARKQVQDGMAAENTWWQNSPY